MGKIRHFDQAAKFIIKTTPIAQQEPCLGLCVIPTSEGPQTPVIIRIKNGVLICDPPGGKPDPGESRKKALEREYGEEAGTRVEAGDELGSLPHPVRTVLNRHFYKANYIKGSPTNRVPKEHEALMMTTVENAITLFGERIPEAGKDYLRSEEKRILADAQSNILHLHAS